MEKSGHFQISPQDKELIMARMRSFLEKLPDLEFAYIHGSFVVADKFRDIDVAVYLDKISSSPLQVELSLETELASIIKKYPIEVRVLNSAPLSFRYNVIKYGKSVSIVNDDARANFEEETFARYFDFAPYREMYLKEALSAGT